MAGKGVRRAVRVGVALAAGLGSALVLTAGAQADLNPCTILPFLCPTTTAPPPTTTTTTTSTTTTGTPSPVPALVAPGAEYDGHDGTRNYAELLVSPDGTHVTAVVFVFKDGTCTNGLRYQGSLSRQLGTAGSIDGQGHASVTATLGNARATDRGGRSVHGVEQIALSVQFAGDALRGTLSARFSSRALRCASGNVRFTAYRDGTAGAPVRDRSLTTGRYRGQARERSGRRTLVRRLSAQVFVPWQIVNTVHLGWDLVCPAQTYKESWTLGFLPIRRGPAGKATVSTAGKGTDRFKNGLVGAWSYALHGSFVRSSSDRYVLTGRWSYRERYYRGGAPVADCRGSAALSATGPQR